MFGHVYRCSHECAGGHRPGSRKIGNLLFGWMPIAEFPERTGGVPSADRLMSAAPTEKVSGLSCKGRSEGGLSVAAVAARNFIGQRSVPMRSELYLPLPFVDERPGFVCSPRSMSVA